MDASSMREECLIVVGDKVKFSLMLKKKGEMERRRKKEMGREQDG